MRMLVALVTVLMIAVASPAHAQQFDQGNAANWYRVAIERSDAIIDTLPPEVRAARLRRLAVYAAAPSETPPADVRDLLERLAPALRLVYRATATASCDFEITEAPGLERSLPHHAPIRRFMHCLVADAMIRLHDGDRAGGSESLAAAYRLAAHAADDPSLASAVFGSALFKIADRVTQYALDRGRIDAAGGSTILEALGRIDPDRPFGFADALEVEPVLLGHWWQANFADDGGARRFLDRHGDRLDDPALLAAISVLRPEEIDGEFDSFEAVAARAVEPFAMDDVEEAMLVLRETDRRVRRGEHGALARLLMPDLPDLFDRHLRMVELVNRRIESLVAIAEGKMSPEEAANAAVWYMRAVEQYLALSAPDRRVIAAFAADPAPPVAETLPAALGRARPVVETLRRATTLPRCDFSAEQSDRPEGVGSYHGPLRRLVLLLHADAHRAIMGSDLDAVVDRFAICFGLASHLSADRRIVSSLLADEVFASTMALITPGIESDQFSVDQRMRLLSAARGVGYRDPFGYGEAVSAERSGVGAWIVAEARTPPAAQPFDVERSLARCDGDQVLFLALAIDQMAGGPGHSAAEDEERSYTSRWHALDGVVSLRNLVFAMEKVPQVRGMIEERRIDALGRPLAPRFGNVTVRGENARKQLSRALLTLRGGEAGPAAASGGGE